MPAVEFDLEAPDAALQLDALLCWPFDPVARANFLVTAASQSMQSVQDEVLRRTPQTLLDIAAQVAAPTGRSVEEFKTIVEALAPKHVATAIAAVHAEIATDLFLPAGGYGRVAAAGGIDAILKSAMNEGGNFGRACGELLVYIVTLRKHHPHINASINRATHIMEEAARKDGRTIPAERYRKTMWTRWGGIAPLWAARMFCVSAAKARGAHALPPSDIVAASLWLADFAVKFRPSGAKAFLLSEDKVVRLKCNLAPAEPEIPLLTAEQLAWATAYRAPIPH